MNYFKMIENASSVEELKRIESLIAIDKNLDDIAKQGYITASCERRMNEFGDLMGC